MSDLNTVPVQANARLPRGAVKLNGQIVAGWVSWEVDNNAYRSADTFRVVFATSLLPAGITIDWFSNQASMTVEIFASLPANPVNYVPRLSDRLILGQVDSLNYNPAQREITLTGRDYTAKLIDTKTSEHYLSKTSSQIATIIANNHGLTPVVTKTSTVSGAYYKNQHDVSTSQQSEWDLLTYLANQEGFDLFVIGNELHFQAQEEDDGINYVIQWEDPTTGRNYPISNVIELGFDRNFTISKGVNVQVRSWNQAKGKAFVANWPSAAKKIKPGASSVPAQQYRYNIPGLTQEAALQKAQSIYGNIVAHEMSMTAYLPGDSILDCTQTIEVRGTNSAFDQIYYPDSVMRYMSVSEGYRMNVRAKNTGPELEENT